MLGLWGSQNNGRHLLLRWLHVKPAKHLLLPQECLDERSCENKQEQCFVSQKGGGLNSEKSGQGEVSLSYLWFQSTRQSVFYIDLTSKILMTFDIPSLLCMCVPANW